MSKKKCRVAILMLRNNPFHKSMVTYLLNCLENGPQDMYDPCIIMCHYGHESDIKTRVWRLVLDKCDVIMPIGQMCTLGAKEALDEIGGHPTIFIGVANPIKHELISSIDNPGGYMTGVLRDSMPAEKIVTHYLLLKPAIKTILIPYVPTSAAGLLTAQAIELKRQFAAQGMQVFAIPIERTRESLFEVLDTYRSRVQSVLFLEGCFSNSLQAQVAYYCWQHYLLFCGTGINAIMNGAACAFSGEMRNCATSAYQALRSHWEHNTPISTIPVVIHPDNQGFFINSDMLRKIKFPEDKIIELGQNPSIKVVRTWIDSPENK
jgi:ABC-type uncharacterized transport system substrate-binding protein